MNIDDFVIPLGDIRTLGNYDIGRRFDYEKILSLSSDEFAEFYLKVMEEYRDKDGWWGKAGIPSCSECSQEISGPKELRRYYGLTLHPKCFEKIYEKEKDDQKGLIKFYWDRVVKLDLK